MDPVVDQAVSGVDANLFATDEVTRLIEFLFLERHPWVVSEDGNLGQLHSGEEEREDIFSIVDLPHLLDIAGAVLEVIFESEVVDIALK